MAIGQTKGQTLLPLPANNEEAEKKLAGSNTAIPGINKNKDALHLLENAVVTWTRQIKGALKATPQSAAAVCLLPDLEGNNLLQTLVQTYQPGAPCCGADSFGSLVLTTLVLQGQSQASTATVFGL